jgi:hypothetical protein
VLHGTPFFHEEGIDMAESDDSLKGKEKAKWIIDDANLPVEPARRPASREAKRVNSGHISISKQSSDNSLLLDKRCDPAWIKLVVGEKCSSIHPAERQLLPFFSACHDYTTPL